MLRNPWSEDFSQQQPQYQQPNFSDLFSTCENNDYSSNTLGSNECFNFEPSTPVYNLINTVKRTSTNCKEKSLENSDTDCSNLFQHLLKFDPFEKNKEQITNFELNIPQNKSYFGAENLLNEGWLPSSECNNNNNSMPNLRNHRTDSGYMSQNDWFNLGNCQTNTGVSQLSSTTNKNGTKLDIWSNNYIGLSANSQSDIYLEEKTKPVS